MILYILKVIQAKDILSPNKNMKKGFVVAIDGPVAAGKGTIAPLLAKKLGGFYLYTGAMYRCLALYCIKRKIRTADSSLIEEATGKIDIDFVDNQVILNGENVTERIKQEDVAMLSSFVAAIPSVRLIMVKKQREIGEKYIREGKVVVAEGRDTATRIFPEALFKLFLTADPKIRADRRLKQIQARDSGVIISDQVLKDINKRDKQDSLRLIDPLPRSPRKLGYFILDNSNLTEEETVKLLYEKIRGKIKTL